MAMASRDDLGAAGAVGAADAIGAANGIAAAGATGGGRSEGGACCSALEGRVAEVERRLGETVGRLPLVGTAALEAVLEPLLRRQLEPVMDSLARLQEAMVGRHQPREEEEERQQQQQSRRITLTQVPSPRGPLAPLWPPHEALAPVGVSPPLWPAQEEGRMQRTTLLREPAWYGLPPSRGPSFASSSSSGGSRPSSSLGPATGRSSLVGPLVGPSQTAGGPSSPGDTGRSPEPGADTPSAVMPLPRQLRCSISSCFSVLPGARPSNFSTPAASQSLSAAGMTTRIQKARASSLCSAPATIPAVNISEPMPSLLSSMRHAWFFPRGKEAIALSPGSSSSTHGWCLPPEEEEEQHGNGAGSASSADFAGEEEAEDAEDTGEEDKEVDQEVQNQSSRSAWAVHKTGSESISLAGHNSIRASTRSSSEDSKLFLLTTTDSPGCGVLLPNSPLRAAWDGFTIVNSTFVGIAIPLRIVYFEHPASSGGALDVLIFIADATWLFDIMLNFRTGFFSSGRLILEPQRIAAHYARSWLVVDILSACPLVLTQRSGAAINTAAHLLKLLRLLRLGSRFSRLEQERRSLGLFLLKVGLYMLLISHLCAAAWRLAQRADHPSRNGGSGGVAGASSGSSWGELYVKDLYWVLMTMTTVGFGDIVPSGLYSRLYAIAAMFIGSLFFGAVISALTHATRGIWDDKVERRVAEAASFMSRRHVPQDLQRRVKHNLRRQLHRQQSATVNPELLALLSPAVQRELSLSLLSAVVLQFPLFWGVQRSFVAELAQVHLWMQCASGDIVAEEGQAVEELVFVVHGRLLARPGGASSCDLALDCTVDEVMANRTIAGSWGGSIRSISTTSINTASLSEMVEIEGGAWFGEGCLFEGPQRVRTATVVAAAESELAVLPAKDYLKVIAKYPRLQERHGKITQAIDEGRLCVEQLRYIRPSGSSPFAVAGGSGPRNSLSAWRLFQSARTVPQDGGC